MESELMERKRAIGAISNPPRKEASIMDVEERKVHRKQWSPVWLLDHSWSIAFLISSSIGTYEIKLIEILVYDANKMTDFGVFASTIVFFISLYVELYRSAYLREKVSYKTTRTATHSMLFFLVVAGISFLFGLWSTWHWLTVPYLFMAFWGVLIQSLILFPVWIQRIVFGIGFSLFLRAFMLAKLTA
uniref:Uncharacterized protein AlNc14C7G991 n=1 Tax=Albugo laibachii Nc14 TaxID=890382 RepID=F0W1R1_9STRA|nr:conserved hypothetical protein [Albugo laibachii Nc14]|eukprot:CCA14990.1 conserved hypothetical protein [Albugo laibachii Nc14]